LRGLTSRRKRTGMTKLTVAPFQAAPVPLELPDRASSLIAAPDTRVIAQAGEGEETLFADLDLAEVGEVLTNLDTDRHFARPDVFELTVDRPAQAKVVWGQ